MYSSLNFVIVFIITGLFLLVGLTPSWSDLSASLALLYISAFVFSLSTYVVFSFRIFSVFLVGMCPGRGLCLELVPLILVRIVL